MAVTIFPSELDISPTPLAGKLGNEPNFRGLLNSLLGGSHVVDGLLVSGTSTITVGIGEAYVQGQRVVVHDAMTAPALTIDGTFYLYLNVVDNLSGRATGVELAWEDDAADADAIGVLLSKTVRSGGTNGSPTDLRRRPRQIYTGTYTGDGDSSTGQGVGPDGVNHGLPRYAIVTSSDPKVWSISVPLLVLDATYVGAGFVCRATTAGSLRPEVLVGSTTWDPPVIASGAESSSTVTVTGAAVGQPAIACLSSLVAADDWSLRAFVTSTNTVTAVLRKLTAGSGNLDSGTLIAYVMKTAYQSDTIDLVTANDGILTPKLQATGFLVKDAAGVSLNQSSKTYSYILAF